MAMTQDASKRTKRANPERERRVPDDIVTGMSLARHLGCSRTNITRLVAEGIIERRPDNHYNQSAARLSYIAHLRSEYRKNPRAVAEQDMQRHRARLYALKVSKAEGELMKVTECMEFLEELAGLVLTAVSGWPARIAGHDLTLRRKAESLIFELRTELANQATERAAQIEAAA